MTEEPAVLDYPQPLRKSITVNCPPAAAFELFTSGIGGWWPIGEYSISQARTAACCIEPRRGGRVYETRDDGETFDWGTVLIWEPPRRLVLSWHPGNAPETAQEVDIRFAARGNATQVDLEHRDWAKLGAKARQTYSNYEGGWTVVLGLYRDAADGRST